MALLNRFVIALLLALTVNKGLCDAHDEKIDELNAKRISELISFSKLINSDAKAADETNIADGNYHDIHAKLLIIPENAVGKLTHISKQKHSHHKNSSLIDSNSGNTKTSVPATSQASISDNVDKNNNSNDKKEDIKINEISSNLKNATNSDESNTTLSESGSGELPTATEAETIQAEDKNVLKKQEKNANKQYTSRLVVKPITLQIDSVTFQTGPIPVQNTSAASPGHHKGHHKAHARSKHTNSSSAATNSLKEKSENVTNADSSAAVSPTEQKTGQNDTTKNLKIKHDEKKGSKLYAGPKPHKDDKKDGASASISGGDSGEIEMVKGIEITALNEVKYKKKEQEKAEEMKGIKPLNDTLELYKNQTYMRNKQDDSAKDLNKALAELRFNNGPSGKVKAGQEFAYLSQCGLYTESQNVSYVQHSWATKIYSPYFYLYEKPKKYEKCKPLAWMNGTDMRGNVFLSFEVKSLRGSTMENNAKICEKYCCKEPRCAAWVLRLQSDATSNCPADSYCCWLKTDVPKMEPHEACVSGIIKREHYKAPPTGMRSSVPLGALGTGSFEMRADGTFHEWTVENQSPGGSAKLSKTSLELMLLGVRVKKGKSKARAAVFRTHAPHGFEGVDTLQYFGSHPVSKLKVGLHKSFKKDLKMNLYAYSTFHPRQPKESSTPAVAFSLSVTNPSNEEMDVSFMMTLPFGFNDDTIRRGNNFAEVAFTRLVTAADCQKACANKAQCMSWTTNGPFSCMLKDGMPLHAYEYGIISGLKGEWAVEEGMLNCKRPGFYPQSGDISLYPVDSGSEIPSFGVADDAHAIWNTFNKTGKVTNSSSVNITALHGAVSTSTKLKPKETKLLTIILSWYFPHRDLSEERVGNFYNNIFKSSVEVAKHFEKDLKGSVDDVSKFQNTIMPPPSLNAENKEKEKEKSKLANKRDKRSKHPACNYTINGVNTVPDCLQDILLNSLSTLRSGMWMENGRWRQWEAYDCANLDPVHVNLHRVIPYVIFYPGLAKQLMLAWADHQLEDGMIQESLSIGCLEDTSKEGVAGGRLMIDVNVGFVVQSYMIYSWTNDTEFFDEIYPFSVRAIKWLIKDSTKGTGLPYRKGDAYDLFELEKYDHSAYNSIMYLLGLRTMLKMALLQKDRDTFNIVNSALSRAEKQFDVEMWDDRREFYHAWFDDEWGSPSWLMSDSFYGQVWAYTLGIGNLVELEKLRKHLKKEAFRNDSPYGLKVISKSRSPVSIEDTSVILGEEVSSCKSLENITKTESIWMTSSTDWSSLQLHLGLNPEDALQQASKSLDNYRTNLRDQWNFHGVTSSEHYGLDGLPWATSHYTFQLVLWHLPLALSGQQYYAPNGTIEFHPKYDAPYWLPFYTPTCMGNIGAKHVDTNGKDEILYSMKATSGSCAFESVSISDEKYSQKGGIIIEEGDSIEWSAPAKTKKDIVKAILEQLKKH